VLGFAQQLGMRRGGRTWWVLVAGDGPSEDLGAAAGRPIVAEREKESARAEREKKGVF